jgi:D-alanine-D-alanine ligase
MHIKNMSLQIAGMKIAVLMGGPGSERKVSLKSGEGVVNALRELGADVMPVDVTGPDFHIPEGTRVAFNVIHGTFGEDGQLQRILEQRGIPYTGEDSARSELAIDKIATKERLAANEVPTAKFEILERGANPTLPVPLVIKAPKEGSSVGVYIVKESAKLEESLREARKFGDRLLVEQYIGGRELTVGIVGGDALPVIEIRAKQDFYNFENKYPFLNPNAAGADHFCPAPLSPELTRRVQETALTANRALELEIYCRVDILLDDAGEPFVLEVNTIPGMTPSSLLPEAAAAVGISYAELCRRIVELSLARFPST